MHLDGFGLFVEDMAGMIRFYRDVLGFEIKENEDTIQCRKYEEICSSISSCSITESVCIHTWVI